MSGHEVHADLKATARRAGLTLRDLARALGEPISTTSGRLNGYNSLSGEQRKTLWATIRAAEQKLIGELQAQAAGRAPMAGQEG